MRLSDFDFDLPEDLIALRPARPRSAARLLLAEGEGISDRHVRDLPEVLRPGDRLILNDTKVIPARLSGIRRRAEAAPGEGEARIEATLLERQDDEVWSALVRPMRRLKSGDTVAFSDALRAVFEGRKEEAALLRFNCTGEVFERVLEEAGAMPLPPYIAGQRQPDAADREDYQTLWAARPGAVAAPTASLHFDSDVMAALAARGVATTRVTLHVGAGTFLPVKVDDVSQHRMHAEWGEITPAAAEEINATKASGGRVIAVGTTALRLIESAAAPGGVAPFRGETDIFIRPGFVFRVADGLMTNFHLPKSTLMMLVSAFMGVERIRAIYDHAIRQRYRFFSYGDASLLLP